MKKPRIIIADPDASYAGVLQSSFAGAFFGRIDLEVITDPDYFHEMFARPQSAEVLLVSELFWDLSLSRHNISFVFLLAERDEEERDGGETYPGVRRLFKYTNPEKIARRIAGEGRDLFAAEQRRRGARIILTYSACDSIARTAVAMGVSACLAENGRRVLYVNAGHLQTFGYFLKNPAPLCQTSLWERITDPDTDLYREIRSEIRRERFYYLPPFGGALAALGLDYSVYERFVRLAEKSGDYDYIVVDGDASLAPETIRLFDMADRVLAVTKPAGVSVYGANVLASSLADTGGKCVFVCCGCNEIRADMLIPRQGPLQFTVDEYIEDLNTDTAGGEKNADWPDRWRRNQGMQRTAFLVM